MKKLLITTALIAISSSAFANGATTIRDQIKGVYDSYGESWDFNGGQTRDSFARLLHGIDNPILVDGVAGTIGTPIDTSTLVIAGGKLQETPVVANLGTAPVDEVMRDIDALIDAFVLSVNTDIVGTDGLATRSMGIVINAADDFNDIVTDPLTTIAERQTALDTFNMIYVPEAVKHNNAINALDSLGTIDYDTFGIGLNVDNLPSYVDWVTGDYVEQPVIPVPGTTETIPGNIGDTIIVYKSDKTNTPGAEFDVVNLTTQQRYQVAYVDVYDSADPHGTLGDGYVWIIGDASDNKDYTGSEFTTFDDAWEAVVTS